MSSLINNSRMGKAIIGRETLQTGGQYPPNCSKMTKRAKHYRMRLIRSAPTIERLWSCGTLRT